MRMMLKIMIPTEAGNRTIKDGSLPKILEGAVARLKAEAAYFVAEDGVRTAMFFFDMRDSSDIPSIVEPLLFRPLSNLYSWESMRKSSFCPS